MTAENYLSLCPRLPEVCRLAEALDAPEIPLNFNAISADTPLRMWLPPDVPAYVRPLLHKAFRADIITDANGSRPLGAIWPQEAAELLSADEIDYLREYRDHYRSWRQARALN